MVIIKFINTHIIIELKKMMQEESNSAIRDDTNK